MTQPLFLRKSSNLKNIMSTLGFLLAYSRQLLSYSLTSPQYIFPCNDCHCRTLVERALLVKNENQTFSIMSSKLIKIFKTPSLEILIEIRKLSQKWISGSNDSSLISTYKHNFSFEIIREKVCV